MGLVRKQGVNVPHDCIHCDFLQINKQEQLDNITSSTTLNYVLELMHGNGRGLDLF